MRWLLSPRARVAAHAARRWWRLEQLVRGGVLARREQRLARAGHLARLSALSRQTDEGHAVLEKRTFGLAKAERLIKASQAHGRRQAHAAARPALGGHREHAFDERVRGAIAAAQRARQDLVHHDLGIVG